MESSRALFAAAVGAMRRILVEHAGRNQTFKRGGDRKCPPPDQQRAQTPQRESDLPHSTTRSRDWRSIIPSRLGPFIA